MFALYTHINRLYKKLSANIWGLISPGNYFFFHSVFSESDVCLCFCWWNCSKFRHLSDGGALPYEASAF